MAAKPTGRSLPLDGVWSVIRLQLVNELIDQIESGGFHDGEALIAAMRRGLESIGDTDTIVKENVSNAVESSGLEVDWMGIYG